MSWQPHFVEAFAAASPPPRRPASDHRGRAHGARPERRVTPVISPGVKALTRARISHVDQNNLTTRSP
jgi:hypothetical protein